MKFYTFHAPFQGQKGQQKAKMNGIATIFSRLGDSLWCKIILHFWGIMSLIGSD